MWTVFTPMLTLVLLLSSASAHAQPTDPDASTPDEAPVGTEPASPATPPERAAPPEIVSPAPPPTAIAAPPVAIAAPPAPASSMREPKGSDLWRPSAGAAMGCALGIPFGGIGALGGAAGVGGALGILTGLPLVVALIGVATGACVGVPAMGCAGPCSVLGATTGTIAGAKWVDDRDVRMGPTLLAALPALLLALAGSVVGAVGTGGMVFAVLGMNPGELRAWGAVLVLAVLLSVFAGPMAALLTVSADALFGTFPPDDLPAEDAEGSAGETGRTARHPNISAFASKPSAPSAMRF